MGLAERLLKGYDGIEEEDLSRLEKNVKRMLESSLQVATLTLNIAQCVGIDQYREALVASGYEEADTRQFKCEDCFEQSVLAVELFGDGLVEGMVLTYCKEHAWKKISGIDL